MHQGKEGYYKIKSNWVLERRFDRCCAGVSFVLCASVVEVCKCKCCQGEQVLKRCSVEAMQMLSWSQLRVMVS